MNRQSLLECIEPALQEVGVHPNTPYTIREFFKRGDRVAYNSQVCLYADGYGIRLNEVKAPNIDIDGIEFEIIFQLKHFREIAFPEALAEILENELQTV